MRTRTILLVSAVFLISVATSKAFEVVAPKEVKPGEVFFIEIKKIPGKDLVGGKFDREPLKFFYWGDKFGAIVGVDVAAKEGEKDIIVEEFAPGDAPVPIQRFLVRVLKPDFPEVKVNRPRLTTAQLKRIAKEKIIIRRALEKSENNPLWQDWFAYPLENSIVSQGGEFGLVRKSMLGSTHHAGVDFGGVIGTPVKASNTGRVVLAGSFLLEGKMVVIDHGFGLFSLYMHLDSAAVKTGDLVSRGMTIGALGRSGRATGPHLHFAFLLEGKRVDPLGLLKLGEKAAAERATVREEKSGRDVFDWVKLGKEMLRQESIYFLTSKVKRTALVGRGKNKKYVTEYIELVVSKEILLAALDPKIGIQVVRIEIVPARARFQRSLNITKVTPEDCSVEKRGGGGVSINFKVVCGGEGRKVVASAHILFDQKSSASRPGKGAQKIIYVPYSDDLVEPAVTLLGRLYIEKQIKGVGEELRRLAVSSRAVAGRLVADIFPEELPFNLSLIEHIDHKEALLFGPVYTGEKVLTQFALNQEDTFRYATSSAGALCLMQIMPSTYREVRQLYPEAKLSASSEKGSCEHKESIKTAYLVLDSKLSMMPPTFRQKFLQEPEKYGVFLAAAYNGGSGRASEWYQKFTPERLAKILKDSFLESMPNKKGPKETWFFIKKYMEIAKEFVEN